MGGKKKKAAGDAAKGEKVFKNLCAVCHLLKVSISAFISQGNHTGPALGGVVGRQIATGEGFAYS